MAYEQYLGFVLSGYHAFYMKSKGLATDGDLYDYCSSDTIDPFNVLNAPSLHKYFDKDGFCTFAVSNMTFPVQTKTKMVSIASLPVNMTRAASRTVTGIIRPSA